MEKSEKYDRFTYGKKARDQLRKVSLEERERYCPYRDSNPGLSI